MASGTSRLDLRPDVATAGTSVRGPEFVPLNRGEVPVPFPVLGPEDRMVRGDPPVSQKPECK